MKIRRMIGRITAAILSLSLTAVIGTETALAEPAWPEDTGVAAEAGIVMDVDSGTVIFGQQIHVQYPPASITKLLTALVVAEHASMEDMVEFSHNAVYQVESGSGNKLSLEEGDRLSVENCMYVMLLLSSNQAANALAEHVAGSREAFVDMMNEKAAALGCQESHFANPSGLNDEEQYVSAYDMAKISTAAFANDKVLAISSSKSHTIPPTIHNPEGVSFRMEHKILMAEAPGDTYYCEGALAGKTGYTSLAGNTLVTYAVRDDRRLVSVILKGKQHQYYLDAKALLDFGFDNFKNVRAAEGETWLAQQEQLEAGGVVYPAEDLYLEEEAVITLPAGAEFGDAQRELVTELPAGAPTGSVALLQYTYGSRKVGSVFVISRQKLQQEQQGEGADGQGMEDIGGEEQGLPEDMEGTNDTPGTAGDKTQGGAPVGFMGRLSQALSDITSSAAGTAMMIGLVFLLMVIAAGAWILRQRKKEREELERRRERRRQRLQEIGYSEEDFEKLLQNRQRNKKVND